MKLLRWIKSDVELKTETYWRGKEKRIDGFRFYTKRPFSRSYQFHAAIGLENTYNILGLISDAIKHKERAILIEISHGIGVEKVYIWKGSLPKAEEQMFDMIKQIQKQY